MTLPLLARLRPLLAALDRPAYLVGGVVRDALLGRAGHDIDLIVERDAVALAFRLGDALGLPAYALDAARDVGRIIIPGSPITLDIAAFRGATLAEDLAARDFTINAMAQPAADSSARVIDYHDGLADLAARRLRHVHLRSIADDPLRALRAARLAVQLGFELTEETAAAARAAGSALAERVSPERVRDELTRLLDGHAPQRGVALAHELGLLAYALPEVAAMDGVTQSPPHHEAVLPHTLSVLRYLVHIERVLDGEHLEAPWAARLATLLAPYRAALAAHAAQRVDGGHNGRALRRWGALLHDIGKPGTRTTEENGRIRFFGHDELGAMLAVTRLNRLAFSNEAVRRVRDIVAGHMRPLLLAADGRTPSRRAIYRYYRALYAAGLDVVVLTLADHLATHDGAGDDSSWERLLTVVDALLDGYVNAYQATVAPARLLNGQEVMELLGIGPGRELGQLLRQMEEAQAAGDIVTRDDAVAFLRRSA